MYAISTELISSQDLLVSLEVDVVTQHVLEQEAQAPDNQPLARVLSVQQPKIQLKETQIVQ